MKVEKFIVFDTETTGLTLHPLVELEKQPRIIEFAAMLTDGVEVLDTLEFLCDPGIAIDDEITRITGITNRDLTGKPPFAKFVPQMAEFFKRGEAVIAHNLSFDQALLTYDLKRADLTLADINFPPVRLCTVEQTMPLFGRRMRLQELYQFVTRKLYVQSHRAMDDIENLHEVCKDLGVYRAFSAA